MIHYLPLYICPRCGNKLYTWEGAKLAERGGCFKCSYVSNKSRLNLIRMKNSPFTISATNE